LKKRGVRVVQTTLGVVMIQTPAHDAGGQRAHVITQRIDGPMTLIDVPSQSDGTFSMK
jgi:hypothetical protein